MKITVVGTGYVGLVTGVCLAEKGHQVTCIDINSDKINALQAGNLPIYEPGLEDLFYRTTQEKRLNFTTDLAAAVAESGFVFLALPTPSEANGTADLSAVKQVAKQLGKLLEGYTVVVNKSTVPVGTANELRKIVAAAGDRPGQDFDVVSNPEFLREGTAVGDFMHPERIVIGTSSKKAARRMQALYEPFISNDRSVLLMDERSAEMTKYAANAMLAMRVSFMNEIANLCERVGADVEQIREGIGSDSRIGRQFLRAGIGFGGSCFPKDVKALYQTARQVGYDFQLLRSVTQINEQQRTLLAKRIISYFDGTLPQRRIAIWGLAFKPGTDDIREAPAHAIVQQLLEQGVSIAAFDPEAMKTTREVWGNKLDYASGPYEALKGADALLICTPWPAFKNPNFERMQTLLRHPVIFDGRNLFDPDQMMQQGFHYYSIGRPHSLAVPGWCTNAEGVHPLVLEHSGDGASKASRPARPGSKQPEAR